MIHHSSLIIRARALLIVALFALSPAARARDEYRVLWVDVFHAGLRTPSEIDTMIQTARAANYNAVFVQVRKACDSYYNSSVEPKSEKIDPQFDPLAYCIQRAHDTAGGQRRI